MILSGWGRRTSFKNNDSRSDSDFRGAKAKRRCLGTIFLIAVFSGTVSASDWKEADTDRQIAYLLLHAVDWGQTRNIARNPHEYYEFNPLLGEHPSVKRVDSYMLASALTHTAISYVLPPKWREAFQQVTLSVKSGLVDHNFSIGLRIDY